MTERSLQVTYRNGRAFAAYLHLSHTTGEKSAGRRRRRTDCSLSTMGQLVVRSESRSRLRRACPLSD